MFLANVTKNQISVESTEPITSGSVNVYLVRFLFSEEWDGLSKVAVFRTGETIINVLLDDDCMCFIPWEVMVEYGTPIDFGVYGTVGTDVVLPTIWTTTAVILEGVITGIEQMEPTPGIYQQIMAKLEKIQTDITNGALAGDDGFSPTVEFAQTEDTNGVSGTIVTITDLNGAHVFTIWNGQPGAKGNPGPKGDPGDTPYIGQNGNWWIGETDTGVSASGLQYSIGKGLKLEGNTLLVDSVSDVSGDPELPITAGGVFAAIGNIDALLQSI